MSTQRKQKSTYGEADIRVLRGLEPVQLRPGMYTDTESPNHIFQEVADNSFDEALAGYATRVVAELHEDGSVSIEDDGRGIPVEMHKEEKRPAVEVIFTSLHSGGKFNKGSASAYGFTGGLHGVGVTVTNALSDRLEVTVWKDGWEYSLVFVAGDVAEPLSKKKLPAEIKDKQGSRVRAWPTAKYFTTPTLQTTKFEQFLRSKAVLLSGVEVVWTRPGRPAQTWKFDGGINGYLEDQVESPELWAAPRYQASLQYDEDNGIYEAGEGFDLALGFTVEGANVRESYVNLIPTRGGGRHENGLRAGVFEAVRAIADRQGWVPKGVKIEAEDVWARMSFILSAKLMDPGFKNQTKDQMTSAKGQTLVQGLLRDHFELWLNDHGEAARSIVDLAIDEAVRRSKVASKTDRKKLSSAATLPGKLTDCESREVERTELFVCEGDSAGGSAKAGRDKHYQAVLPIRGKLLNTWDVTSDKAMISDTVNDIATAIGVDPHTLKEMETADLTRLRYGKIFIMADADVDGQHIQVLLLTLFFRHFPALIERGHIWVAQSPLFRIDAPAAKKAAKKEQRKFYALNEEELAGYEKQLIKEGFNETHWQVSRFKGLGEMNPQQLKETTMNPDGRRSLRVSVDNVGLSLEAFELMMNGKNAKQRRDWMEADGGKVEADL